jgi:hypothetical protein
MIQFMAELLVEFFEAGFDVISGGFVQGRCCVVREQFRKFPPAHKITVRHQSSHHPAVFADLNALTMFRQPQEMVKFPGCICGGNLFHAGKIRILCIFASTELVIAKLAATVRGEHQLIQPPPHSRFRGYAWCKPGPEAKTRPEAPCAAGLLF